MPRRGFDKVRARLAAGLLGAFAVSGAFCATPVAAQPADGFMFGMESNNVFLYSGNPVAEEHLEHLERLGVDVLRIFLPWGDVAAGCQGVPPAQLRNPDNPCYNWAQFDYPIAGATERGIKIIASVSKSPPYIAGDKGMYYTGKTEREFDGVLRQYVPFLEAAAKRYSPGSEHGHVEFWTIWNEPNSKTFWQPWIKATPERYARMVVEGARALKRGNPKALVAPGPTGPQSNGQRPLDFLKRVQPELARLGSQGLIDAWAHNPYPGSTVPPSENVFKAPAVGMGNIEDLFVALDAHPVTRGLPVWGTEFSYQTSPEDKKFGVPAEQQAAWVAACYEILWRTGRVPIGIWYVLRDPEPDLDWQSGLIYIDGREKPSYLAYMRQLSLPYEVVPDGASVSIWSASTHENRPRLVWSADRLNWYPVPGQVAHGGGVVTADVPINGVRWFAVRDWLGLGPAQAVRSVGFASALPAGTSLIPPPNPYPSPESGAPDV